ncbi:hypothetical protein B0H16DRAFT_1742641 [Mycena metata]|uniref:Uncharacterized protein n=1 Tax=Mycena metata TaxID=1033252 RepID=A0AAD7H8A7_9AGAR|nr:hypothetical protein B0H16DRAFT_1742641 [Mycena metata]
MAHTFVDSNIDPNLLAMDPTTVLLAQMRTTPNETPSPDTPSGGNNEDPPATPPMLGFSAEEWWHSKSMVVFDHFICLRLGDEHNVMLFGHLLELLDIARKNEKADQWTIGSVLSRKINSYTQAFILCAQLRAYRGLHLGEHVVKSMRDSNVLDFPPEEESTNIERVLTKVSTKATHYRNILKAQVKTSLEPKSDLENIANLADKLLHGTSMKHTPQFYLRLTFIRWVMVQYPWLTEETFWIQVDETIKKNSQECKTKEELDKLYNFIYEQDIRAHGDPATTEHQVTEFNAAMPSWYAPVRTQAGKIQPNPKNPQLLLSAGAPSGSKKRRLEDEEEDGLATEE